MSITSAELKNNLITWARTQKGKKIGDGECWTFAEKALEKNNGKTSNDLGTVGKDTDYIWGDAIQIASVSAGDILQFRDHKVVIVTVLEYTFQDGATWQENKKEEAERGHHTAIANGTLGANGMLKTLDQHVKPLGKVVQEKELYTRNVPANVTNTSERRKHPYTKKMEIAQLKKTVTINVSGQIWAYNPKPK